MERKIGRVSKALKKGFRKDEVLNLARNYRVTSGLTSDAIRDYYSALNCPRSLACWLLFDNNEHGQLVELECDPLHYSNAEAFGDAYRATLFLSKSEFLKLDVNREEVALRRFQESEHACMLTNARLRHQDTIDWVEPFDGMLSLQYRVQCIIADILGEFSPDEFLESGDWGPGATTLIKGDSACAANKFHCESGITRDLLQYLISLSRDPFGPRWYALLKKSGFPKYQVGNKVTTVPKNAKTDRVIAIEPGLNLWFQKALGTMIRKRLRRVGVDLNSQSRNQSLALQGSSSGELATIDFSSASDMIAYVLVEKLLPQDWFEVLDRCRSHYGISQDRPVLWNKFSSMGNGFTFELESLIFFAMAKAVTDQARGKNASQRDWRVSVYGDDVILPQTSCESFTNLSAYYGFIVNKSKSFIDGPFRESCGKHFYDGVPIAPIYLKSRLSNLLSVFKLANAIRTSASYAWGTLHNMGLTERAKLLRLHPYGPWPAVDKRFKAAFGRLIRSVPSVLRLRVPVGLGDGGFVSNFDEATPARAKGQIEGFVLMHLREESIDFAFDGDGLTLGYLWQLHKRAASEVPPCEDITKRTLGRVNQTPNGVSRRGMVALALSTKTIVPQWHGPGPWI